MNDRIIVLMLVTYTFGSDFYVAKHGDDSNPGTFDSPFLTIQQAADTMIAGDICYIRQGLYHESVTMDDHDGADGFPIVFTNYNNERVAMDGTVPIDPTWQVHSGNIWKTTLDYDIWQLFVDWNEMVMARWPNANFEDGSIWNKENHWGHGTIDEDSEAYENGTLIDAPHGDVDLAESGLDITDAIAILNVGSFKTWTRRVLTHSGNTFTYNLVPGWKTKHHDYFLEGMLEFLDVAGEWFFNAETKILYFWAPNGADPNELQIRGKVQSYAFDVSNSDHVQIKNLEFFGTTFKFDSCDYVLLEGCNLFYPSCYKRMLGIVDTQPEMSLITSSSNCIVSNSAFRYTDGSALEMYSGSNKIEECYFYHIDYTSTDLNGLMTTIQMSGTGNIFRRNTLHKLGASATLNPGDEALIELNNMYDSGYMQSDGALVQCMVGQQPGVEIRYNWFHDTIKYGARFDGNGDGNNGLMHHNVIWNVIGGIMIKGFEHNLYNNTAFDNGDKNDIIVMIDQGGNEGTITRNNAANKIAGHRTGTYQDYPVPGIYDYNWNGYETDEDVKNLLLDPENHDFRPHPDSALVDAGIPVEDITDDYVGDAPDLGAYENGGEFWVPGITWDVSATFGDDFEVPDDLYSGPNLFNLLVPEDSIQFEFNFENIYTDSIVFVWESSNDLNDSIIYHFFVNHLVFNEEDDSVGFIMHNSFLSDTVVMVHYEDIRNEIFNFNGSYSLITWDVSAIGGTDTIQSINGPFNIRIDASAMSVDNRFIPNNFVLHQNYPNPFNPITTIRYDLPKGALVNITIYDMMGRVVKSLVNTQQMTGYKSIIWNATNNTGVSMSAGIYLYNIRAGNFRQTKKMVLLK
ncbi:MAG: T9SS type A sorting domain-containing protein [Candidatus Neomarinimicrobiota bacterium]|nr:T9SS type A sorting domain-containing protein [Candidatus Neomarinimicrobiota bacterium]